MSIKVSFKDTIQKIHKIPETYTELALQVAQTFKSFPLPEKWVLQYTKNGGTSNAFIDGEETYKTFLNEIPSFDKAPKLFIVSQDDDYCKIEKQPEVQVDANIQEERKYSDASEALKNCQLANKYNEMPFRKVAFKLNKKLRKGNFLTEGEREATEKML